MTLHRMDLPDAPVRVHESRLNPGTWLWRCLDAPLHHSRGYDTWREAWDAMEKHRLSHGAHGGAVTLTLASAVRAVVGSKGGTVTYVLGSKP